MVSIYFTKVIANLATIDKMELNVQVEIKFK